MEDGWNLTKAGEMVRVDVGGVDDFVERIVEITILEEYALVHVPEVVPAHKAFVEMDVRGARFA